MNGACIMPLERVLGPLTGLIKSHVIRFFLFFWEGGVVEERSLALTSSTLCGMGDRCERKSKAHTDEEDCNSYPSGGILFLIMVCCLSFYAMKVVTQIVVFTMLRDSGSNFTNEIVAHKNLNYSHGKY